MVGDPGGEGEQSPEGIFETQRLLVKHGSEYRPPESHKADDLKALMQSAVEEESE